MDMIEQQFGIVRDKMKMGLFAKNQNQSEWVTLIAERFGIVHEIMILDKTMNILDLNNPEQAAANRVFRQKFEKLNRRVIAINRKLKKFNLL